LKLGEPSQSTGLLGFLTSDIMESEVILVENSTKDEGYTQFLRDLHKRVQSAKWWRFLTHLVFFICIRVMQFTVYQSLGAAALVQWMVIAVVWLKFEYYKSGVMLGLLAILAFMLA
jgi:hypothetical protein